MTAAAGYDFMGVQNSSRTIIGPDGLLPAATGVETNTLSWEYHPASLRNSIAYTWAITPDTPIFVTENCLATRDDARRIDHTEAALAEVVAAMDDGIEIITGVLYWSLLDHSEWGSYEPTFGLVGWDRITFVRPPKPPLAWLGSVASSGIFPFLTDDRVAR